MAGLDMGKDLQRGQDGLPTPLRRRTASPGIVQPRGGAADRDVSATHDPYTVIPDANAAAAAAQTGALAGASPNRSRQKQAVGVILALALAFVALLVVVPPPPTKRAKPTVAVVPQEVSSSVPLLERVAAALSCEGPRADIVDILAGAPYEFLRRDDAGKGIFLSLPRLVARVMKEKGDVGVTRAESELQDTVSAIAAHGASWSPVLQQRILAAVSRPCKVKCSGEPSTVQGVAGVPVAAPIALEVDTALTSPGTVSARTGWLHQTLLSFGATTRIPLFRKRAEMYKSRPASTVVSPKPITPGDCFALRGKSSVALRIAGASRIIRQVVIEQPPHWMIPNLWSLPGRFEVWGEPAAPTSGSPNAKEAYSVYLGSFAYAAAGPAPQAFELQNDVPLRGLRLAFDAPVAHGPEDFFCIYRVRAFESKSRSCTQANGKTAARLVNPVAHGA